MPIYAFYGLIFSVRSQSSWVELSRFLTTDFKSIFDDLTQSSRFQVVFWPIFANFCLFLPIFATFSAKTHNTFIRLTFIFKVIIFTAQIASNMANEGFLWKLNIFATLKFSTKKSKSKSDSSRVDFEWLTWSQSSRKKSTDSEHYSFFTKSLA